MYVMAVKLLNSSLHIQEDENHNQQHMFTYIKSATCNLTLRVQLVRFTSFIYKSKGLPQQAEVAQEVPDRLRPRIFLMFRHYKGGSSSAIRTGRLYRRRNPWYSFSEAKSTSGHMVLSGEPRKKSPVTPPGIDPGTPPD